MFPLLCFEGELVAEQLGSIHDSLDHAYFFPLSTWSASIVAAYSNSIQVEYHRYIVLADLLVVLSLTSDENQKKKKIVKKMYLFYVFV